MKKLTVLLASAMMLMPSVAFANGNQESAKASNGPVELTLWHRWSGTNGDIVNELVDSFEQKNPDIKITVVPKPGEYVQLLQSMIADMAAGNNPPDLFIGGYNMLNYITRELHPTELKDLAPNKEALDAVKDRYLPSMYQITQIDGKQIGLPFALSNIMTYVNMDIFRQAGLTEADIPETWDDVIRVSRIIKEKTGKYAVSIQTPDTWSDSAMIYSLGGSLTNSEQTKVDLTNPACVQVLSMWQDLVKEGLHPNMTDQEAESAFVAGDVAMRFGSIMKVTSFYKQAKFDLKAEKFPVFPGHENKLPTGGSALISFSKDKAKKDAVWKFMDYATSKEGMTIFTKTGYLCVTKDKVPVSKGQEKAYEQMPQVVLWPNWPGGAAGMEIERLYLDARNSIIMQGAPVKESLQKCQDEANKLL